MYCTASISGKDHRDNHNGARPSDAPACEYVPMLDGSSSDAPVIRPGPRTFRKRNSELLCCDWTAPTDSVPFGGSLWGIVEAFDSSVERWGRPVIVISVHLACRGA